MIKSLADVLSKDEVVWKGVEQGGTLHRESPFSLAPTMPCRASPTTLYDENKVSPFFLSLVRDAAHGPLAYRYQLDERQTADRWQRSLGVAHLVSDNQIALVGRDGSTGTLTLTATDDFLLYRLQTTDFQPVVQSAVAEFSCVRTRDKALPCVAPSTGRPRLCLFDGEE